MALKGSLYRWLKKKEAQQKKKNAQQRKEEAMKKKKENVQPLTVKRIIEEHKKQEATIKELEEKKEVRRRKEEAMKKNAQRIKVEALYDTEAMKEKREKAIKIIKEDDVDTLDEGWTYFYSKKDGKITITYPQEDDFDNRKGMKVLYNTTYEVDAEEVIQNLIKNNFDKEKTKRFFQEKAYNFAKKNAIEYEIDKLREREKKRNLKQAAEKKFYGKVKTKRRTFSDEERDMILNKFGNRCAVCGKEEGLHIHHKDGNPKNNNMNNVIVLCGVCHKKIHMKVR